MPIEFVRSQGHQFNTMSVRFILQDEDGSEIQCAVSDAAMDDAERARNTQPQERDDQFDRLKDKIVGCAIHKFVMGQHEDGETRVLVRTADLNRF
jgi:hypothetical protein